MSTSGSFTPAGTPACPAPMTRAALLALRTAGTLRPECHYVITDGPVIGTAGNTSPTIIELHAVTSTDIAREAKVSTTFDNVAFEGTYDIDAGAAGSLNALTDHWGNRISDEDANAPTVHTQFPYHLSSTLLRDNNVNDCLLPGWAAAVAAGVEVIDNDLRNSTADLTGVTSGRFSGNTSVGALLTFAAPSSTVALNNLSATTVSCLGTGALTFQGNTGVAGSVTVDAPSTAAVDFSNNQIGGASGGFRVAVAGKTGAAATVSGNRMYNRTIGPPQDLLCSGPALITVNDNSLNTVLLELNGTGSSTVEHNDIDNSTVQQLSTAGGSLNVQRSQLGGTTVTVGAANAGSNNIATSEIRSGGMSLLGPVGGVGQNDIINTDLSSLELDVSATATAGVQISGGRYHGGQITQNRTAGTGSLLLSFCSMLGPDSNITDSGTVDPGRPVSLERVNLTGSDVNIGNLAAGRTLDALFAYVDMMHSTINLTGLQTAFLGYGRMMESTLTNAGFELKTFTMDGAVKTLAANVTGKAVNPGFDNF